jgi:tungstate transport system ATP-binding protein
LTLFEVKDLTKVYGSRTVLDIPELCIEKGKVYGLLGPNGSGKTTLLEILGFLSRPTTGLIVYNAKKVHFLEVHLQEARKEVVMVGQQPILFTTSVYKNVEFGLKVRKVPRARRERVVHEVLDLVGMRDYVDARAHKLSGGETQRVAIARALACSPQAILFDEPTANVDVENQIIIERILKDINSEKGISVIFATHDRIQATRLSDRMLFLFQGKPASSIYENLFSGSVGTDADGNTYCLIHDKLKLNVRTHKTGEIKISIEPRMIKVFQIEDQRGGDQTFAGQVMQLTDEGGDVRALIDIGIPISVLLGRNVYKQTPILTGQRVAVVCPPESVEIM